MAPEQASGDLDRVGPLSDQYSLGVVLFELLTGEVPFRGSAARVLADAASPLLEAPHFRDLDVKAPAALEAVCRKALAKRSGARYRTAGELADDLDRFLTGRPVQAGRGVLLGLVKWATYWCRQHWGRVAVAVLVAAAFAAAGLVWRDARRQVADVRAEMHALQGEYLVERGLRLCETKAPEKGVLYLAEAFGHAERSGDLDLRQRVAGELARWVRRLPPLPLPRPAWDEQGERLLPFGERLPHVGDGRWVVARPDGRVVALTPREGKSTHLVLRDARTGEVIGPGLPLLSDGLTLGPDGRTCVGGVGLTWWVLDVSKGADLDSRKEEGREVRASFAAGGRCLLVRRVDVLDRPEEKFSSPVIVRVWRLDERGKVQPLGPEVPLPDAFAVGVTWDGELLVTSMGNRLEVHEVASGQLLRRESLPWGAGTLRGVGIGPEHLATCDDSGVRLWEWDGHRPRVVGPLLSCPQARAAVFSSDGRLLLARGEGGTWVWDVATQKPLGLPLPAARSPATGQKRQGGPVRSWARFSGDGRSVLTGEDADVRLWPLPPRVADQATAVTLWVQLRSGMELIDDTPRSLDAATRQERRQRLEGLLGL
jgi:hypothetical protein